MVCVALPPVLGLGGAITQAYASDYIDAISPFTDT